MSEQCPNCLQQGYREWIGCMVCGRGREEGHRKAKVRDMSEPFQIDIRALAGRLTTLERGLLIGAFKEWGSWMPEVGGDLCALGLMKRDGPNIVHTRMGRIVADRILAEHKTGSET